MKDKSKARSRAPLGSVRILVAAIVPNPEQPRKTFDEAELRGLAQSIEENDLIQPIVVERQGDKYVLVDGERRLRAVKMLRWASIPAVVRSANGDGRRQAALVANVQRSNLGPIEEGLAYRALLRELGSVKAVAKRVGVSESIVDLRLNMLTLAEPVQRLFEAGQLPIDTAMIGRLKKVSHAEQERIAMTAMTRGWSGRSINKLLNKILSGKPSTTRKKPAQRPDPEPVLAGKHFDALALVPRWRKLPPIMLEVTRNTCKACDLYEQASLEICQRCPLVDYLGRYLVHTSQV